MEDLIFDLAYDRVKDLSTKAKTNLLKAVQNDILSLSTDEQLGNVQYIFHFFIIDRYFIYNFVSQKNFVIVIICLGSFADCSNPNSVNFAL